MAQANPALPCHDCGTEEQFLKMKRSDDWRLEVVDDETGEWVAYCPDCSDKEA